MNEMGRLAQELRGCEISTATTLKLSKRKVCQASEFGAREEDRLAAELSLPE